MSQISNHLITLVASKDNVPSDYILEFIRAHLGSDDETALIKGINSLLASAKTRFQGLDLLKDLIGFCMPHVLNDNLLQWAGYCIKNISEDANKELRLRVLTRIIANADDVESFNKSFLGEHLNNTLKACLTCASNEEKIASLQCLSQCMKRYPTWFGNHRQKVEKYLFECLDSSHKDIVESAANSFMYFLQTGGAGNNGINYINNFNSEFKKLCATIQSLYNRFFQDFPEIEKTAEIEGPLINFSDSSSNDLDIVARRIINCLIFLKAMIIKAFPVEKRIVVKHVVDIIHRGLSVHLCYSQERALKNTDKHIWLIKIQHQLLTTFRAFMRGYRSSLIPFSVVVENCLSATLIRIHKCNCFDFELYYKISTFKTLINWFSFNKIINENQLLQKIAHLLWGSIGEERKGLVFKTSRMANQHLTSHQRRLFPDYQRKCCFFALETLKCLLTTSVTLEENLLKRTVYAILKIVKDINTKKIGTPFDDVACQVKLYEVLISLFKTDVTLLPPLHLTIDILNTGLRNPNGKVVETCREGLYLLEKISHPTCPTLQIGNASSYPVDSLKSGVLEANVVSINGQYDSRKDIHIISNIMISPPRDLDESEGPSVSKKAKHNDLLTTPEENLQHESDTKIEKSVTVVEEVPSERVPVKKAILSEEKVICVTEKKILPVSKGETTLDGELEDMFDSFQDVVQE